jgi:trk system potassium uptake protein TrkH
MRLALVVHLIGVLVRLFGTMLAAPLVVAAYYGEWHDAAGFLLTGTITVALGHLMRRAGGRRAEQLVERLRRAEGLTVVALTWLLIANLAAIPYAWVGLSPVDALFEAMSGLTTTGSTVLRDFTVYRRGIFFWRSLTQWLGGMGVIALFVAVLPRLAIGGRELFFAEVPGPTDEKLTPQIRQTALALWRVYAALTGLEIVALLMAGMTLYEAVCHAFTTLAAGGFSPHPLSIAGYRSAAIDWIVIGFMFLAGTNFALQYRVARGHAHALVRDEEFRAYVGVVAVGALLLAWFLAGRGLPAGDALRHGAFQTISIVTTTGYASVDFQMWSDRGKIVLLLLMFIGGSAGSAGGGPKIVRHVLMARFTIRELKRTLHPRAVLPVKLGGRVVSDSIMRDVVVFMLFYLLMFACGAAAVVSLGADLVTGLTATIATLGNIGPGFNAVGPMANFADLHPISKIVLTLEMWIGRLEVLPVLVVFRLDLWRGSRWRLD